MKNNFQRFLSLLLILCVSIAAFADSRSLEEAQNEAVSFLLSGKTGMRHAPSQQSVTLGYTLEKINSSDAAAYLFQIGEDNGFVIVSADNNTTTILGYAIEGSFNSTNIPDNMQMWLQHYAEEISWASERGVSTRSARQSNASPISPLLGEIVWNQDAPFWNMCPYDSDGNRSYSGCVATATAQIMRYWKYPVTGEGSHSYTWTKSNGSTRLLSADFGNTTYDWDNMLPNYYDGYNNTQANAVATLMYHLGVATEMGYSSNGSGTQTEKAAQSLFTYFGYDKSMQAVRPDFVGFDVFEERMLEELQASRPVLMSGSTINYEGHAFVCDGFDGEYFHINWGWGGYQNGYFALSALDPEEQGMGGAASGEGFHVSILGVMGIQPDQGGELGSSSLGTLGLRLQADNQIKTYDTFTIKVNQIKNTGILDYEGGAAGLAVLDEDNNFICWFDGFYIDELPVGYYYPDEYDFIGDLSGVSDDGDYMIAPIFTDEDVNYFWFMDVGYDSPQHISFTKVGNDITFNNDTPEIEYSITNLVASSSGSTISFSFESDAPYFHVKIYNSEETLADDYIDFKDASLSDVPDGTWTVWVCAADENFNDVGEPATASVTVEYIDYNVYNLEAYSEGSDIHFSFESNAPKFHVKVYNDTQQYANGIIDFKNVVVSNVPDGEWTVWVRPCDDAEEYYVADAVSVSVTVLSETYKITYYVDGEIYKEYTLNYGATITPEAEPTKEGYTFSGWSEIPATMPAHDVEVNGTFSVNQYTLTFDTDGGSAVAAITQDYGTAITAPVDPTKEGYTFTGWNPAIPETMPAENMTIKAQWSINSYKLTYVVDGETYKEYTLNYGEAITPEAAPTKEGYTFSGWSELPATMPAHDIEVNGTFSVNQYTITFDTDGGSAVAAITQDYGTTINAPANPTKEGYTFTGWNPAIPETMPAENMTIKAQWSINSYKLTYVVDGETYKEYTLNYGEAITPEAAPTKEGYTFSGWSEIPATMPAHDVIVDGSFKVNIYNVSYFVNDELVHQDEVAFGETFELWVYVPEDDDLTFNGWIGDVYETMPAHDIEYKADITSGIAYIINHPENVLGIYTLDGKKVEKIHQGVYVVRMKDGSTRKFIAK